MPEPAQTQTIFGGINYDGSKITPYIGLNVPVGGVTLGGQFNFNNKGDYTGSSWSVSRDTGSGTMTLPLNFVSHNGLHVLA
ncbi:MAG: hypothetical protein LBU45_05510 [Azoarcus sp.]|jgi:hypothetical protein|nr:hypothetical protein [Azoarcus sp.]